jgi:hypothetical protein
VTYAIVAHSRPHQLLRLVRALRGESPRSSVVIHWDSRAPALDRDVLLELGDVYIVETPVHAGWGDFEFVMAALLAMRAAVEHTQFDWLVLLSGQDYPIAPLERIERELVATRCDALLDPGRIASGRLAFRWRKTEATRLGRRYFFAYWSVRPLGRWLPRPLRSAALRIAFVLDECQPFVALWPMPAGVEWRLGVRRLRTPFATERRCRVGSAWLSLSRRAVERVLRAVDGDTRLLRHFRRTIIPDESFFQTVVCADSELTVHPDNLRYQVWAQGDSPLHPNTLTVGDVDAALRSGKHFARKLDELLDEEALDRIDAYRRAAGALV